MNTNKYKSFKLVSKNDQDDDEDNLIGFTPNQIHLPYFESTSTNRCIKVSLDENIKESKYYRNWLQSVDSLGEGDLVLINIDSYGGQLDGAIAIIDAIQSTEATVHTTIKGVAASAASLIALASPSVSVAPYATMMIHSATFGAVGKQSDVIAHATFVDKQVRTIMQDIYKDFLTEVEIKEVMMGREIWMDSEEIIARLEHRNELQEKAAKAEMKKLKTNKN